MGKTHIYRIYCLSGKRKKDIFYVGHTKLTLEQRLRNHLLNRDASNEARCKKIEEYFHVMEIHELEVRICTVETARKMEKKWMIRMLKDGHKLVNKSAITWHIDKKRVFPLQKNKIQTYIQQ